MCPSQLKSRQIVIEICSQPRKGGMAGVALLAEPPIMVIIFLVAGITGGRRALKNIIDVTGSTGYGCMRAGQFESRQAVVKAGIRPTGGCVAITTALAQVAIVGVILLVAGVAGGWRASPDVVHVTFGA